MSHTSGPWRVVQRRAAGAFTPKNGLTLRHLAVDTGSVVWTPSQVLSGGYTEEHLKQARLIAATPELLEACRAALGAFEHNDCIDWNILSRAIRKAAGGAL